MNWSATIAFTGLLRDVQLVRSGQPAPAVDWEARVREAEETAYERGRRDGEKAVGEQLVQQRAELLEVHQGVVESLRQALPALMAQMEDDLMALALEAARKLVAELPISPEMVEAAVRDALNQVKETSGVTVHLHPEDYALLQRINSPLLSPAAEGEKLSFRCCGDVARGGCLVQSRFGMLDAGRETKLVQLKKAIGLPVDVEREDA